MKYYTVYNEPIGKKIRKFLENSWPSIYRSINNFLIWLWEFVIDTIRGLWPGR